MKNADTLRLSHALTHQIIIGGLLTMIAGDGIDLRGNGRDDADLLKGIALTLHDEATTQQINIIIGDLEGEVTVEIIIFLMVCRQENREVGCCHLNLRRRILGGSRGITDKDELVANLQILILQCQYIIPTIGIEGAHPRQLFKRQYGGLLYRY